MNEQLKKLTGKNKSDYEEAAKNLVDNCDTELFKELVEQENYLFDFVKQNVAQRIYNACNKDNYKNLIPFMNYYSPSYDACFTIQNQFDISFADAENPTVGA